MLRWRLPDRRGLRQPSVAVKLFNGHLQLPELGAEFLQELGLTLLHGHELLLDQADARQQALLHRHHSRGHVEEGALQLALECQLTGAERLEVALKDAGNVVVDLEHFVLQRLDAVSLAVAGCRRLDPAHAVQVVLAAEIPHQLRQLDQRRGAPRVRDTDDVRDACSHCWRARACAATASTRR